MDMIFEIPYSEPEKLPTLKQWLEKEESVKLKQKYHVMKIWFPAKFPNLTFQTENFRVLVSENNPAFLQIQHFAETMIENETHFAIVVNAERDGGYGITSSGEKGTWENLGKHGYEWKPKNTPKRTR